MPQLITSTYPSQIFWTLVGFFAIYLFVSMVFCPRLGQILNERDSYLGKLSTRAGELRGEARDLDENSLADLQKARDEVGVLENKLVDDLHRQTLEEKALLRDSFSEKSRKEFELLVKCSGDVLSTVSDDMDGIVETALLNIFVRKKS